MQWLWWVPLAIACGRVNFDGAPGIGTGDAVSDRDSMVGGDAAGGDAAGGDAAGGDATGGSGLVDDFDRPDSSDLGPAWDERTDGGDFSIVGNQLVWVKASSGSQDNLWALPPVESLDQWLCFQLAGIDAASGMALVVVFRGEPGGFYWGIGGHAPPYTPNVGLWESFQDTGFLARIASCNGMGTGLTPGDWMCATITGLAANTTIRLWHFDADPGPDPATFPAPSCTWGLTPSPDDQIGLHVGLGVWSGDGSTPPGTRVIFDHVRGGSL